jgi:hypothetical protein
MSEEKQSRTPVTIHDIDIPFWSLVTFLVKLAIAAIPAAIIVTIIVYIAAQVVGTLFYKL